MRFKLFVAFGFCLLVALFTIEATFTKKVKDLEGPALYKCNWSPETLTLEGWVGKVAIRTYHFRNNSGMKYTVKNADYRECRALPRPPASPALKRARQQDTAIRWFYVAGFIFWLLLLLTFQDGHEERVPWERKSHFRREWAKEEDRRQAIVRAKEEERLNREREKSRIAREERINRKAARRAEYEARRAANKARKEANNG